MRQNFSKWALKIVFFLNWFFVNFGSTFWSQNGLENGLEKVTTIGPDSFFLDLKLHFVLVFVLFSGHGLLRGLAFFLYMLAADLYFVLVFVPFRGPWHSCKRS